MAAPGLISETAPYRFVSILLMPPRDALYAACGRRFEQMIADGALAEAALLDARGLAPDLPAMKRQMTWFRHQIQITADLILNEQYSESLLRCSRHFVDQFLLTG